MREKRRDELQSNHPINKITIKCFGIQGQASSSCGVVTEAYSMTIRIVGISMCLIIVAGALVGRSNLGLVASKSETQNVDGPELVVREFLEAIESDDQARLAGLVTVVPDAYYRAKEKEVEIYSRMKGEPVKPVSTRDIRPDFQEPETPETSGPKIKLRKTALSLVEYSVNLLVADSAYIDEVMDVWVKGSESRVRIRFLSRKNPNYRAVKDVLLFRSSDTWKIFIVEDLSLVNVYGMETPEIRNN
ncbi:MAG: hypothetical protein ABL984_10865 [Pyrinomonadaceae bacterium]